MPIRLRRAALLVLVMHVALAGLVTLRGEPVTQDGPSHAYAAHILHSLAHDPSSPFRGFFRSNLRLGGNSLFFYIAEAGEAWVAPARIAGVTAFVTLLLFPLSAAALAAALQAGGARGERLVSVPAAVFVACPLAYNYLFYLGLFNFVLSVPLAIGCIAAVVASGVSGVAAKLPLGRMPPTGRLAATPDMVSTTEPPDAPARTMPRGSSEGPPDAPARTTPHGSSEAPPCARARSLACMIAAVVLGALASLAHPAAAVFLALGVVAASLVARPRQRVAAAAVVAALVVVASVSSISSGAASRVVFATPWASVGRAVRTLGVSNSWLEVVPALLLLAWLAVGAARALRPIGSVAARWKTVWPAAVAASMMAAYFFVPSEYGGAAGHNERIPLVAAMLLAPFVPVTPPLRRWFPAAFALFAVYTGAQATRFTRVVEPIRSARAADAIPRGAVVFPVPLLARMGAVEVSYARHLLADVALRRDLVMPDVFCSHPAHPLACEPALPARRSEIPVGRFESLDPAAKSTALSDPDSFIARAFHATAHEAAGADFLLVLGSDELRPLFEREVVRPLSAVRVAEGGPLLVYRLPRAVAQR